MNTLLKKSKKGFTLIELMIVVAIIGILAAIAIPNFIRYQLRSKTAEARTNIGGIKTSQESFRASEDNYANVTVSDPGGIVGTVKTNWVGAVCVGCDRTQTQNCTQFSCIGFAPAGLVYYNYTSPHQLAAAMTVAEYAATAQADLDNDTNIGSFCLQSGNTPGTTAGVVPCVNTACANGSPGEVRDCAPGAY
jgi:type IV pilus assembly protein PilA